MTRHRVLSWLPSSQPASLTFCPKQQVRMRCTHATRYAALSHHHDHITAVMPWSLTRWAIVCVLFYVMCIVLRALRCAASHDVLRSARHAAL